TQNKQLAHGTPGNDLCEEEKTTVVMKVAGVLQALFLTIPEAATSNVSTSPTKKVWKSCVTPQRTCSLKPSRNSTPKQNLASAHTFKMVSTMTSTSTSPSPPKT